MPDDGAGASTGGINAAAMVAKLIVNISGNVMMRPINWLSGLLILLPLLLAPRQEQPRLLITEIFYDSVGEESQEEWFEIGNFSTQTLSLARVKVGDAAHSGGGEGMVRFPPDAEILPGAAVVVAQTAVGFQQLYGFLPDFELQPTDERVPDMVPQRSWADGAVALANSGDELLLLGAGLLPLDGINYGEATTFFSPAVQGVAEGASLARVPADCDTDTAVDWQPQSPPTPGELDFSGECVDPEMIEPLPPIGRIQGRGEVSPFVNGEVTLRGVVTGFYSERNSRGVVYYTAFLQDLPGREDGDPQTSDGIALFLGRSRPLFSLGDQLRVEGLVTEYYGLTEIEVHAGGITIEDSGLPLPEPVELPAPEADLTAPYPLEQWEGMHVRVTGPSVVMNPTYSSCGFSVWPQRVAAERIFRRVETDPGGPLVGVLHETDMACGGFPELKAGDRVSGIQGPLTYHFEEFKVVQTAVDQLAITFAPLPEPPHPPELSPAQFTIATYNLENFFDTMDDTGDSAEPKPTTAAINVKQAKIVATIGEVLGCPTLLAVQEVEKAHLLVSLAGAAADYCGFTYEVTHMESPDVRGIDVALLSNPERVQVRGAALRQGCTELETSTIDPAVSCASGQAPLFSRPPLVVETVVDGRTLWLIVNHFKSKRGGAAETAARRLAQANHVAELVQEIRTREPGAWVVVLGDFNDYENAPALQLLQTDLDNLLQLVPAAERYSYVYGGRSQLIDGILATPELAAAVVAVQIQHVNANFPAAWGDDVSAARRFYRSTDHDLPIVVIAGAGQPAADVAARPLLPVGEAENVTDAPQLRWTRIAIVLTALISLSTGFILVRRLWGWESNRR
jgi:predicted extracellular nuclease